MKKIKKLLDHYCWKTGIKKRCEGFEAVYRYEVHPETGEIRRKPNWYKYLQVAAGTYSGFLSSFLPSRVHSFMYRHYLTFTKFFDRHQVCNKGFVNYFFKYGKEYDPNKK